MTVGSKVNPNFPIPGIDQSSRGFRDNFATIKQEIENLQTKKIQLTGAFISPPVEIGNNINDVVIPINVNLTNVQAAGSNLQVQYNFNNRITGSEMYYNAGRVGIGTALPGETLHVIGNIIVQSRSPVTSSKFGNNLQINASPHFTTMAIDNSNVIVINNANLQLGIGTAPTATFDLFSNHTDIAILRAAKNNSDNTIRATTDQTNATLGLALEQRTANKLGGIRIDQYGNISLHVAESMDANLSDASRVINILTNNNVGIGSMSPKNQLDVQGNTHISGTLSVGSVPTITGSRGGNAALASLLTALATIGLIIDSTSA